MRNFYKPLNISIRTKCAIEIYKWVCGFAAVKREAFKHLEKLKWQVILMRSIITDTEGGSAISNVQGCKVVSHFTQ